MKPTFSPFREFANECRALSKLRRDIRILGEAYRYYVQQSRAFRFYWFTRCVEVSR
jgi:hypothetical protein